MSRRAALAINVLLAAAAGCLPATNPCDPSAPDDVRAQAVVHGRVLLMSASDEAVSALDGGVLDDGSAAPPANGLAGVTVVLSPLGLSTSTGADGSFQFDGVIPPSAAERYEVVAFPVGDFVGGRTRVPDFACGELTESIDVPVVAQPRPPEVEIAAATGPQRFLVSFPADGREGGEDDLATLNDDIRDAGMGTVFQGCDTGEDDFGGVKDVRYRFEVREPFGQWRTGLVAAQPVLKGDMLVEQDPPEDQDEWATALAPATLDEIDDEIGFSAVETISGSCARAACGHYTWAYQELRVNVNARCAEVIGFVDDDGTQRPLELHGRYEVRVLTEEDMNPGLAAAHTLPASMTSPAGAVRAESTLTPTHLIEVQKANGGQGVNITAITAVLGGGFAMINNGRLKVVTPMTEAESRDASNGFGTGEPATNEAMQLEDEGSLDGAQGPASLVGTAQALLPTGNWVRVWTTTAVGSTVDHVFVGDGDASAPQPDLTLPGVNTAALVESDAFMGFGWMRPPGGRVASTGYTAHNSYALLFDEGVALIEDEAQPTERRLPHERRLKVLQKALAEITGVLNGEAQGVCSAFNSSSAFAIAGDGPDGDESVAGLCIDFPTLFPAAAAVSDFGLSAVVPLLNAEGEVKHVVASRVRDEVYVVNTDEIRNISLLNDDDPEDLGNLSLEGLAAVRSQVADLFRPIPVGLEPSDLLMTRRLTCDARGEESGERKDHVLLVANRGSRDVSMVAQDETTGELAEVQVISLPGAPVKFVPDPDMVTCPTPYVWVMTEEGNLYPIDMRSRALIDCGGQVCSAPTRSRARAGAISRDANGTGRLLIGGDDMLGEIGYLRPTPDLKL